MTGLGMVQGKAQRWAVVTGASSGIGRAFVLALVARGWSVVAVARREKRLRDLQRECAPHGRVEVCALDLGNPHAPEQLFTFATALGPVELLVNNAGYGDYGAFMLRPLEIEMGQVRVNVAAVVELARRFIEPMRLARRGTIINISSLVAFQVLPFMSVYAATKAFVQSFSESLAEECRGTGVHVLCVSPGNIATEFDAVSGSNRVNRLIPTPMRRTAEQLVLEALEAMDRGRETYIPGWMSTFAISLNRLVPRIVVRRILGNVMRSRLGEK